MNFLKKVLDKDKRLGFAFRKRFGKMIIFKDKKTGKFIVAFRSKSDLVINVFTDQKKAELIDIKEHEAKN